MAVFAFLTAGRLWVDKYRFQYMDKRRQMVFRYDNAPHYPEVESHPHHKHVPAKVAPANMPTLEGILEEIAAGIFSSEA
jgi:hypothetical protein